MHSTKILLMGRGMASTHHGQQRILKRPLPLLTYIQKAVKAGTYRTREEVEEMRRMVSDNPEDLQRIRSNFRRGSRIQDYPAEYQILSLNPPLPFEPNIPVKERKKIYKEYAKEHRPTDKLVAKYLSRRRQEQKLDTTTQQGSFNVYDKNSNNSSSSSYYSMPTEEYYRRLLGTKRVPRADSAMASKSSVLNKAYAFAVKQYEIMRTEKMSEQEALDKVEELLQQEDKEERYESRSKAESIVKTRQDNENVPPTKMATKFFPDTIKSRESELEEGTDVSILFSNNQRGFEGMIEWTAKLQSVPYARWTVGASVALDHWIAKRVLGLSEETWLALLEGDDPNLISRGRDIVVARHALFPETILDDDDDDNKDLEDNNNEGPDEIDELLALLSGFDSTGGDNKDKTSNEAGRPSDLDSDILKLTEELQEWRAKNVESPYEEWSEEDHKLFETWLEGYVSTITPGSSIRDVDMEQTRQALLASPPQSQEESNKFWDSIRDETAAETLLNHLTATGPPEGATEEQQLFWDLPYHVQLEKLVNLGAIREIVDEYTKESDRLKFLTRYGMYLMQDVEIDHLVSDPDGQVRGEDLGSRIAKQWNIQKDERFRIVKLPYGSDEFGSDASKRSRDLFRAWNRFKAGRAHYEEKLFRDGRLGLLYEKEK